ncbi:3-oxoacyl-[acyl-carrier protein] reductase [Actinokineospora alba]|uniref:3-oxoacyl-[acyl-carrier protein] reductase n=1 Tax=Actinokineospora alba TaxID=504798 RepID=A0A1H0G451_9PSEU|nr:SDR family oxidoreductase [Actinokineospora alba]TDP69752.1 3-oxoacyl-[acyl-carrier protein] reductase [Actinokineospora alba]SDI09521.1 3-oxoacyl-[acyl-carrier protein] reductase [Actinokineospora alba]SDO01621.1 3-oxoacyl-[acyl-carrier protein] reductase [Actinokineospora alba]
MRDPMLPDLTGTVSLVTGASGGIGGGIAWRFAQAGSAVVLHFHRNRPTELLARIEASGGRALAVGADLTRGCDDLIDATVSWGGRLDTLVNNAGIQPVEPLESMSARSWREMIETNLTSAVLCTQAAARAMAEGSVTHIASIEASHPTFGHAHYGTAKAALVTHARAAALEYGPQGIRVNAVSPGLIDRPGLAEAWPEGVDRWRKAAPLSRLGTPEDVADACVFLASPLARWITGHNLVVDGGVSAHPTW